MPSGCRPSEVSCPSQVNTARKRRPGGSTWTVFGDTRNSRGDPVSTSDHISRDGHQSTTEGNKIGRSAHRKLMGHDMMQQAPPTPSKVLLSHKLGSF